MAFREEQRLVQIRGQHSHLTGFTEMTTGHALIKARVSGFA